MSVLCAFNHLLQIEQYTLINFKQYIIKWYIVDFFSKTFFEFNYVITKAACMQL